jgi:hypothetical protein
VAGARQSIGVFDKPVLQELVEEDDQSKAQALCSTNLKVLEERREASAAAHPFFWAAFTLTGPSVPLVQPDENL